MLLLPRGSRVPLLTLPGMCRQDIEIEMERFENARDTINKVRRNQLVGLPEKLAKRVVRC